MVDSDLAILYGFVNGTKTIHLEVKRHINRFPARFVFKLTKDRYYEVLRFQSETLELEQGKFSKCLPYVFTEQGIAMLATLLMTEIAAEVSIKINFINWMIRIQNKIICSLSSSFYVILDIIRGVGICFSGI